VSEPAQAVTYLFSDIEGSTRLWELEPERMRPALARHDAISRAAVLGHGGTIVKMTGDGVHAAFDSPLDALASVLELQHELAAPDPGDGIALKVRCGLHRGADERRRGDFFGPAVNRAARIMSAAHGGQILVSQVVAELVRTNLPAGITLRDLGAVRLRDLATPERVYQVVDPELRADFPALRSLEATPNNLAQQLNSFIGREREMSELRELLAGQRLVTLLGMGGLGKSRLSVQLAAEVIDDYPDGVWLVELAPLSDPQLVAQAVATVLGVKEEAGRPVLEALVTFARDRKLLIVLDNCEHVVRACAELTKTLLQASPDVKILATSRDHLLVAGETVYHVPPLTVPSPGKRTTLDDLTQLEAVRLFVDRATASRPDFRLTERNAGAVEDICFRLDGIPLAIELAAARARAMSAEAISARLKDRFRLLVTGDQTVLPRQRTLRALIDWSYDLLPGDEQQLFQRLSVFAGGWSLEAVEAVGADSDLERALVLDRLAHLVEKSLVAMDADGARYRMLDTVRQYALERLSEARNESAVHDRHRDFFLALAERARPELVGPDQGVWLSRLDAERENLLAAHAWCGRADGDTEPGLRLVFALRLYWINRGLLALGHRVTVEILARPGLQARDLARCRALVAVGQMCFFVGRDSEARRYLTEGLSIARDLGDTKWIAGILQPLGMACLGERDFGAARAYLEEGVSLARELGNKREIAAALNALAMLHRLEGQLDEAEPLYRHVVDLARELGDQESIAIGLLNLSMVCIGRGATSAAPPMLLEAVQIAAAIGSRPAGFSALEVCAGLAAAREDWKVCATFFGAAEANREKTGLRRDPADDAFIAPLVATARGAFGSGPFDAAASEGAGFAEEAEPRAQAWLEDLVTRTRLSSVTAC
jgi:predicted ATPase/class 3 adenylate cyclase